MDNQDSRIPKKSLLFIILFVIIVVAVTTTSVYFYQKYSDLSSKINSLTEEEQINVLVERVGRHFLLPEGETPTVFTVTEKDKLREQAFFTNAKIGDKVLVYNTAKKAFLYDPKADKVLEVGPVTISTPTPSVSNPGVTNVVSITPTPIAIRFFLYNGTAVIGLTKRYETELKSKIPEAQIIDRDNANRTDYNKSLLIDLKAPGNEAAKQISKVLGIELSALPSGESKPPDADYLIILGTDKDGS